MSKWEKLESDLRRTVEGEVRFDPYSRRLYSTDASSYQIEPIGVVIPRSEEDVRRAIEVAADHRAPILPRGGGTSLAGQAVGKAIVLDFSKYMTRVLDYDLDAGWVRVEPGLVQDHLNDYFKPHGFCFGPNTSTSSRATIGGMLGNNSSGSRSIVYGKMVDHVIEASGYLSDGESFSFGPLDGDALQRRLAEAGRTGDIYRGLHRLVDANRDEIARRYPKIMRRVSGYNLDELARPGDFNLAKVLVGAEGTLGVVTETKVNIIPRPRAQAMLVVHFERIEAAFASAGRILAHGVSSLELMDRLILDLAENNIEARRGMKTFIRGRPDASLFIEFFGETGEEAREKVEKLSEELEREGVGYAQVKMIDPADQAVVNNVRKAGLGFLLGKKGDGKSLAFIEDCAVAPEKLERYYHRIHAILQSHGAVASYYGHVSVGLLHIRPIINLKDAADIKRMAAIAQEVADLVLEFGGAMSGEHGDGLARSQWIPKFFGPQLYDAFRQVKHAFDPEGLMNPGKIVDGPSFTENLRFRESEYKPLPIETVQDFSADGGFLRAIEMCNGVGACRKRDGTMCPSYQVTREEEHSTRGRANALREVIAQGIPGEDLASKRLYQVLDLCLGCKGCKAECPSSVDMAKIKGEVLQAQWDRGGTPLRVRLLGSLPALNRLSAPFARLTNAVAASAPFKWLMDRFLGIDRRRTLPALVATTFQEWFEGRPIHAGGNGKVLFLNDTFTNYNFPEIGQAAVQVLEAAGYEVILAKIGCCGRTLISGGLLREGKAQAEANLQSLSEHLAQGVPIVGVEPSCLLTFRDEYPDLVPGEASRKLAESAFLLEEFLLREKEAGRFRLSFRERPGKMLVHGHCHQKSLVGTRPLLEALRLIPGAEVEEIHSGCCGMAGSFGFEKEHYDISMSIGELTLFPAVRGAEAQTRIVANGVSCRQQIAHGTGRRARHLAEYLAEALEEPPAS
ncbi:MAG: FAD-binding protein [bacterium]|nr:FAD-binding protein [bacterium]